MVTAASTNNNNAVKPETTTITAEARICGECRVLPAAHPETDLCVKCAPVDQDWLMRLRLEKLVTELL